LTTKFTQHTQTSFPLSAIRFQLKTNSNTPLKSYGPLDPAPRTLASASTLHSLAISGTAPRP